MPWGDEDRYYDEIEWTNIGWLKTNLPSYLAFHERSAGHLAANFVTSAGLPLGKADVAAKNIRRIGYLSYSIFVNVILARDAAPAAASVESMLQVYDRSSRFFLRAGAAIDLAKELWNTTQRGHGMKVKGLRGAAKKLADALDPIDAFNNYTKHGGLTPSGLLRAEVDGESGYIVLLPKKLSRSAQEWADHGDPEVDADDLLDDYLKNLTTELETFYAALVADTPRRLTCWGIATGGTPKGVRDLLGQQEDGYVISSLPFASGNLGPII